MNIKELISLFESNKDIFEKLDKIYEYVEIESKKPVIDLDFLAYYLLNNDVDINITHTVLMLTNNLMKLNNFKNKELFIKLKEKFKKESL